MWHFRTASSLPVIKHTCSEVPETYTQISIREQKNLGRLWLAYTACAQSGVQMIIGETLVTKMAVKSRVLMIETRYLLTQIFCALTQQM